MFNLRQNRKLSTVVKGLFQTPIQYEVRVSNGDWSPYFGHYQNQKWGQWDSNSCWCLSAINCAEDQLEWLWKNNMFSDEAREFFTSNGYIDQDGDFSLSERFLEVLGGNYDEGGTSEESWQLMQKYGCIPRDMFTYTKEKANSFPSQKDFSSDYFNKKEIVPLMNTLGQSFLKYVKISYQRIGITWKTPQNIILEAALKQAPLQVGVPIPRDPYQWNSTFIQYDGKVACEHEVELYKLNTDGSKPIFDQYLPNLKTLSKDYLLAKVTQGILTAVPQMIVNPVEQSSNYWIQFWTNVWQWMNGNPLPYPNVQVGRA